MKKSILVVTLLVGMAAAKLFAVENMISIGATMDFSYWKDITSFSGSDWKNSWDDKNFNWGVDLNLYTFYSNVFGMGGSINMTFPRESTRFFDTWGVADFFIGPVFRIPLGTVFALMLNPGLDVRIPTNGKAIFIGMGGSVGSTLGFGQKALLLFNLNISYDMYDILASERVRYLSVRPTIGIGRRL